MEKVVNGGGNSRNLRKILLVFLSVLMLAFGSILLTACGESSTYAILLLDEDETTPLYAAKIAAGDVIDGVPTPTKEADAEYTYTFSGWVDANGNKVILSFATKDVTAYATYTATKREYSLTISANGSTVSSYEQVEVLRDGKYLTTGSPLYYGDTLYITVNGSEGYTVSGNVNYSGLDKVVDGDLTYYTVISDVTISFSETANIYTVSFYSDDGQRLLGEENVTYGSSVTYSGSVPEKSSDAIGSYSFTGWGDVDGNAVNLNYITSNLSVYAKYSTTYTKYTLEIQEGANITVSKSGVPLSSSSTIYYGDILTIEKNPAEGHYISSLQVNSKEVTTGVWTVQGNTTITCEEEIYTFTVYLYNQDSEGAEYTLYDTIEDVEWGMTPTYTNPTKATGNRAKYTFLNWVDSDGDEISLSKIKSDGIDIYAYAVYSETLNEYTISLSENMTVMLENGEEVTSANAATIVIYYGDTFTVTEYSVPDTYNFSEISFENASLTSGTYTILGNVTLKLLIQKWFVADAYYNDDSKIQKFSYFNTSSGQVGESDDYVLEDSYIFFNYIGVGSVDDIEPVYVNFLNTADVSYTFTNSSETQFVTGHESKFDSTTNTWTSSGTWYYTDYVTTPLTYGMEVEFTMTNFYSGTSSELMFGLSTYDRITDPASYTWSTGTITSTYQGLFVPNYNIYSSKDDSSKGLRYLTYGSTGKTYLTTLDSTTTYLPFFYYSSGNVFPYGETVTIKIVLNSILEIYIISEDGTTYQLPTPSTWTITKGTDYYLSFFNQQSMNVTFVKFGYTETLESAYVSSLSGEKITILGDSITEGTGTSATYEEVASDAEFDETATYYTLYEETYTRQTGLTAFEDGVTYYVQTSTASSHRYATLLADLLGMEEDNMGIGGMGYCTGREYKNRDSSRISDIPSIDTSSEIVVVYLGINDYWNSTSTWGTLGTFDTTGTTTLTATFNDYELNVTTFDSSDTTTIYGAINAACKLIYDMFSGSDTKVYICMSSPTRADASSTTSVVKGGGYSNADLVNATKTVAEAYGFGVIDVYNGISWSESLFSDYVHPNNDGHAAIANYIYQCIVEDNMYDYALSSYKKI